MSVKADDPARAELVDATVKEVACDGGGSAGHPLVYLPFGDKLQVICYYCGKRFEKRTNSRAGD